MMKPIISIKPNCEKVRLFVRFLVVRFGNIYWEV
jgi:hypothetical protein